MSLWESVSDEYKDAAKAVFPLHRLFTASAVFVGAIATRNQTHLSIIETLLNVPLKSLNFDDKGFLAAAMIQDAAWGILFTAIGWLISSFALRKMFNWIAKLIKFNARVILPQPGEKISVDEIKTSLELLDTALSSPRKRLHKLNSASELFFGCAAAGLAATYWGNILDFAIAATLLVAAIALHGLAIKIFLSDYLGPALYKASLLGKKLPTLHEIES